MTECKDFKHLKLAKFIAEQHSKDITTKVGAVIISPDGSICNTGYNGIARGLMDNVDRMQRPIKYKWMLHAECNAIVNSARERSKIDECTMYVTHYPCPQCFSMIINSGIKRVVTSIETSGNDFMTRYKDDVDITNLMSKESGVIIDLIDYVDNVPNM